MNVYIQLPLRLPKVQDQKSSTRHWLSFSGWGREQFSLVFDHKGGQYIRKGQRYTNVNILQLARGYLNATMNGNNGIPEPEIGTNRSSQTRQNTRVDGYGSGFGPLGCSESGFCTGLEANRTLFAVRARTAGGIPGPLANTRHFARAYDGILAGADPLLDTMNAEIDTEMKKEVEEMKFHRMGKFHKYLEMWQGSWNLRAIRKESSSQNKEMTAMGYISVTEAIVKSPRSLFQHDGAAASETSEWSPLPPPLSARDLPGGETQILNVCWIRRINLYTVESDDDSISESISDTEDWPNRDVDCDIPNNSEADCAVDVQSDIDQCNRIKDPECAEQRDVSTAPKIPAFIPPTQKSKTQAEVVLMTVNAIGTRRNHRVKKT